MNVLCLSLPTAHKKAFLVSPPIERKQKVLANSVVDSASTSPPSTLLGSNNNSPRSKAPPGTLQALPGYPVPESLSKVGLEDLETDRLFQFSGKSFSLEELEPKRPQLLDPMEDIFRIRSGGESAVFQPLKIESAPPLKGAVRSGAGLRTSIGNAAEFEKALERMKARGLVNNGSGASFNSNGEEMAIKSESKSVSSDVNVTSSSSHRPVSVDYGFPGKEDALSRPSLDPPPITPTASTFQKGHRASVAGKEVDQDEHEDDVIREDEALGITGTPVKSKSSGLDQYGRKGGGSGSGVKRFMVRDLSASESSQSPSQNSGRTIVPKASMTKGEDGYVEDDFETYEEEFEDDDDGGLN